MYTLNPRDLFKFNLIFTLVVLSMHGGLCEAMSSTKAMAKDQMACTMCSDCDNPCPPIFSPPPPPSPSPPPPAPKPYYCPPPPSPPPAPCPPQPSPPPAPCPPPPSNPSERSPPPPGKPSNMPPPPSGEEGGGSYYPPTSIPVPSPPSPTVPYVPFLYPPPPSAKSSSRNPDYVPFLVILISFVFRI